MSHQVVVLANISIATSGDYRDYYEVDGQRISHTIDPRSQRPIQHALASVSVLHEQAAWADALATALNVMGPVEGFRFANEHDIAALFLVREPTGHFRAFKTPAMERHSDATSG
jgi:thiamine biosynthesis lipoprotein